MRSTIFQALAADIKLNQLGLNEDTMFHNWNMTTRPVDGAPFAILRWGRTRIQWGRVKHPTPLTIWVHFPLDVSNDHSRIDPILARCDEVLSGIESSGGVGFVQPVEWSEDHYDEGFQTISKSAQYNVLSQREAA